MKDYGVANWSPLLFFGLYQKQKINYHSIIVNVFEISLKPNT